MSKFDVSDLIEQGLVKAKEYPNGLKVLKYSKKVFWNNLWHLDDRLLDCRGTVVNADWNVVTMPFTKVFNYGENGTTVDPERHVYAVEKVNGFMASVSFYDGIKLISTTGTLDSDFVSMAYEMIQSTERIYNYQHMTFLFEICHPDDPHIIDQKPGAYLIGARGNHIGSTMLSEEMLDMIARDSNWMRPKWYFMKFGELLNGVGYIEHEGFMIRDRTGETLCKIKTPYYLTKKFFMRIGKNNLKKLFENPSEFKKRIDEEYYDMLEYITDDFTKDEWEKMNEQQRGSVVENFLNP
jgi:hypothetical protein